MLKPLMIFALILTGSGMVSAATALPPMRPRFEGILVAVSDIDMAATAYADGRLDTIRGGEDTLSIVSWAEGRLRVTTAPASNSVVSWPEVLAVSNDGRHAFVVETRGPAPTGTERLSSVYEDLPPGGKLQIIDVSDPLKPRLADTVAAGLNPQSVSVSPDGRFLVVSSQARGGEAIMVTLEPGRAAKAERFALSPPYRPEDERPSPRTLHWGPRDLLALNVSDRRIQFYRVVRDDLGQPTELRAHGDAVEVGRQISVGKWTPDGRHFLVVDTNWADSPIHMLTQGPGTLTTIAVDASSNAAHRIADRLRVGRSPEGFALSDDGQHVVTVNMERTYLPERWYLRWWPGRSYYTLTLAQIDPETGRLTRLGPSVKGVGLLPEDAVFDRSGRHLAVAVFHRRHGEDRRRGFIDFYSLIDTPNGVRLRGQNADVSLTRGVHDLARLP